jgi:hypothetical protein
MVICCVLMAVCRVFSELYPAIGQQIFDFFLFGWGDGVAD